MFPNRLGPAVLQSQFDPETAGAHAAKSIRKHTDSTHAAVLALIDELLAMAPRERATALEDHALEADAPEWLPAGVAG